VISRPDFSENAIVIVDDTEAIATCVKTFLNSEGYNEIEKFDSPRNALDEIRLRGCPAVIITDYQMPAMTGGALLQSVLQMYPQARGFIITSYSTVPDVVADRFPVIRKDDPDFFSQLLRQVREELASGDSCL
jgi:DNA-binding NtrC family response regulator